MKKILYETTNTSEKLEQWAFGTVQFLRSNLKTNKKTLHCILDIFIRPISTEVHVVLKQQNALFNPFKL